MAKLGSTVDARLSRISPYAIRAIEMGGAAKGAGYAALGTGLGKAITSVMHQTEESRIDEILNEALMPREDMGHQPYTPVLDSKGKATTYSQLDEKAIRRFLSDKKVFGRNISEKRIASFLKQESDAINSNNTTQLALDTFEETINANKATAEFRQSQAELALADTKAKTALDTQQHAELMQKFEDAATREQNAYELKVKTLDAIEASDKFNREQKAANEAEKLRLKNLHAENLTLYEDAHNAFNETNNLGDRVMGLEKMKESVNMFDKLLAGGGVENIHLSQSIRRLIGKQDRVILDMESLATADDVAADAGEPWEVKLENAGNQMRKTLEAQLLPEQLEQYKRYLLDGQETESSRGFLGNLKNQLEAQGGKLRPGSGEQIVRDSIDLYLTTFENPDVSLGNITPSYESEEEKQKRIRLQHANIALPGSEINQLWTTPIKY